ncbi:MAG: 1-acyl-sn-glycerol-3-phosphate acyltransferase [Acidobacteria bacterium]|nr:1-acyl-sn-glycerol-3-phosphate acyltransferase [Acidobacteriota bacterium]
MAEAPRSSADAPRGQPDRLERLERALARVPRLLELAALALPQDERPWVVFRADEAGLRAARVTNVFDSLRFELEDACLELPPAERPRGWTLARAPLPRDSAGRVDREALRALLGDPPPRVLPPRAAGGERLPEAWETALREALGPDAVLSRDASLEHDLGLDSLARLALGLAIGAATGRALGEQVPATLGELVDLAGELAPGRPIAPTPELVFRAGEPPRSPFVRRAGVGWPVVRLARIVGISCWLRRAGFTVVGRERVDWAQRPLIIAQNHQSYIDPLVLAGALSPRVHRDALFLGFSGYYGQGPGSWAGRLFRIEPIAAGEALRGLRVAAAALRAGRVLVVYPEGERSWDGGLRPLRRGVAWLARETGAAVVPSAIRGAFESWPRGGRFRLHPLQVAFGVPLPAPGPGEGPEREFLARLRQEIGGLMAELGRTAAK